MSQVINFTTVDTVVDAALPLGGLVLEIRDATGALVDSKPASTSPVVYSLGAGTYTARLKYIDGKGNLQGTEAVSTAFTVPVAAPAPAPTPTVTIQTAGTLTVTVS